MKKSSEKFDVAKHIKFVPPFQEADFDKYFLHFEKIASNHKWSKVYCVMLLQSVLFGKGREISTQISVEQVASKRRIHSGVQTFIDEQKAEMWKTLHNLQKIFH